MLERDRIDVWIDIPKVPGARLLFSEQLPEDSAALRRRVGNGLVGLPEADGLLKLAEESFVVRVIDWTLPVPCTVEEKRLFFHNYNGIASAAAEKATKQVREQQEDLLKNLMAGVASISAGEK